MCDGVSNFAGGAVEACAFDQAGGLAIGWCGKMVKSTIKWWLKRSLPSLSAFTSSIESWFGKELEDYWAT
eukprot:3161202-Prorocentrum_lima.AAC.1